MRRALLEVVCVVAMAAVAGCGQQAAKCTVTQYGSEYMTYIGSRAQFNDACRQVLRDLSYKETVDENKTRYPYYGEGGRSFSEADKPLAAVSYFKTKDANGDEYKITTVALGKRDPVVILESTCEEQFKLVNALNAEFAKRGIRVRQY